MSTMHELSIVENIVDTCEQIVHKKGGNKVKRILLRAGSLCAVERDALIFVWDEGVKGSVLENAEYAIEVERAKAVCTICKHHYEPNFLYDPCPNCGHFGCTYTAGRDFSIVSITMS